MANSEMLALLRTNKAEFQRIRKQDPRAELDLSGADLSGCDISDADLAGAKLKGASLRGANCTGTMFRFADLSGADLRNAKLEKANFHQTNFEGANLEGAVLGGLERETRMCLHVSSFRKARWSREELETMLSILNQNEAWEIRYSIVPKAKH